MEATGQITKKFDDLGFGCITVKGIGDIFFNPNTEYIGSDFLSLAIGQKVKAEYSETSRGLLATSIKTIDTPKQKPLEPEAGL